MAGEENEPHFNTDAARAASTPNIVRWVLLVSLFAAIALLSIIWITGAATQEGEDEVSVSAQMRDRDDDQSADGLVSGSADELQAAEPGDSRGPGDTPIVENE